MNDARQVPNPSVFAECGLLPPEAADCATALAAGRRRPERCKTQDQELKRESFPCLINPASTSTYSARKSVRRTRAAPAFGLARRMADRCKTPNQDLEQLSLPSLLNSVESSSYLVRKSVLTTPDAARHSSVTTPPSTDAEAH